MKQLHFFHRMLEYYFEEERACLCFVGSFLFHLFLFLLLYLFLVPGGGLKEESLLSIQLASSTETAQPQENPKNQEETHPETETNEKVPVPDLPGSPEIPETDIKDDSSVDELKESMERFFEEIDPKRDATDASRKIDDLESLAAREEDILKKLDQRRKKREAMLSGFNAKSLWNMRLQRHDIVETKGGGKLTEASVLAGLDWLKRHQSQDGRWDVDQFSMHCKDGKCGDSGVSWGDPAVTGLALLAFLGAGNSPKEGIYKSEVGRGLSFLQEIQGEDGCFGPKQNQYMYNHSIATLSMVEGYLMSQDTRYRDCADRGVKFLLAARNPGSAWRYTYRCRDNDTSVTGWCMMALKAAITAELDVPKESVVEVKRWLDSVTMMGEMPWVGYTSPGQGYGTTAVGTLCRILFQEMDDNRFILGGAKILGGKLPGWGVRNDFYSWYNATMSMYQVGGEDWTKWNESLKKTLLQHQEKKGCSRGSWGHGQYQGGRVYWTALNTLSLEVYYRYPRIFRK